MIHNVQDLFIADDLEAAGRDSLAEWVRSHDLTEEDRQAMLRHLGRYADAHAGDDPVRRADLELGDHLDAIGCSVWANEVRGWDQEGRHDDVVCFAMGCLELLDVAAQDELALRRLRTYLDNVVARHSESDPAFTPKEH